MSIFFCIEDGVSRAVAKKLIAECCPQQVNVNELGKAFGGYGYIKKNLRKFCDLAHRNAVVVITDLDKATCPPSLRRSWLGSEGLAEPLPDKMIFCIAQSEIEAWLLADVRGFAEFLKISPDKIDKNLEFSGYDVKDYIVRLAKMSRDASIKRDLVPQNSSAAKIGISYEYQLNKFIDERWNVFDAAENSISLRRAIKKMQSICI